jgi:hypothetical protein
MVTRTAPYINFFQFRVIEAAVILSAVAWNSRSNVAAVEISGKELTSK